MLFNCVFHGLCFAATAKDEGGVGQERLASGGDAVPGCIGGKSVSKKLGICELALQGSPLLLGGPGSSQGRFNV